jgi:formylglycine-generating enzyme required for sulfatase activity
MKQSMKRLFIFLLVLLTISCSDEFEFNNPIDPSYTLRPPSDLQIVTMIDTSVTLQWTNNNKVSNSNNEFVNEIEQSTDGIQYHIVKSVDANTTSLVISDTFLTTSTYYFRLRIRNSLKTSIVSNIAIQSLSFPAPSNLRINSITDAQVSLSWIDNSIYETSFEIEQSTDSIHFEIVSNVASNTQSITLNGTYNAINRYYFRVRAKSLYNYSSYSNMANIMKSTLDLVFVEGGTYLMGSPDGVGSSKERPQHQVTLSSYYIVKYEVTLRQWTEVVEWKKTHGGTSLVWYNNGNLNYPVGGATWNDVQTWIGYLNQKENTTKYRLLTEAEWEYAARGGNKSKGYKYSGSDTLDVVGWYRKDDFGSYPVLIVGMKYPNELGIFDMSGNVYEWCNDWYGPYTNESQTNPQGPVSGTYRVARGGSNLLYDINCRVVDRQMYGLPTSYGSLIGAYDYGLRVVKDL